MKRTWIPEWLGHAYAVLYSTFGKRKFSFEEAKETLGEKKDTLLKIMSELSRAGFLVAGKGEKRYQVSRFQTISDGVKARKDYIKLDLEEKLRQAGKEYEKPYLIVGSYAAFLYHQYQFPVEHKIQVRPRDYGFWVQLLSDEDGEVKPRLPRKFKKVKLYGLSVEPPERVIINSLRSSSLTSTLDALAVMVSENARESLNWSRLKQMAIGHRVVRELGALLDFLNQRIERETGKRPFSNKYIDELLTHVSNKGRKKEFPRDVLKKRVAHPRLGKRWRLRFYVPDYLLDKVTEDVAVPALE